MKDSLGERYSSDLQNDTIFMNVDSMFQIFLLRFALQFNLLPSYESPFTSYKLMRVIRYRRVNGYMLSTFDHHN